MGILLSYSCQTRMLTLSKLTLSSGIRISSVGDSTRPGSGKRTCASMSGKMKARLQSVASVRPAVFLPPAAGSPLRTVTFIRSCGLKSPAIIKPPSFGSTVNLTAGDSSMKAAAFARSTGEVVSIQMRPPPISEITPESRNSMISARFSLTDSPFSRPRGPASEGRPAARESSASFSDRPLTVSLIFLNAGPCVTEKFSGRFAVSFTSV